MEKIIKFDPAYDKRDPDPNKNYGIGSVRLSFVLKGKDGAVQFVMSTGWYLPHIDQSEWKEWSRGPTAWDLGYHSPTPFHGDHSSFDCEYIDGGKCYYDGSTLNAEPIMRRFFEEGQDAVWEELENYYHEMFGNEEGE